MMKDPSCILIAELMELFPDGDGMGGIIYDAEFSFPHVHHLGNALYERTEQHHFTWTN